MVSEIVRTAGLPVRVFASCRPLSAAGNRNLCLEWAQSDTILMLDDDIEQFPPGWARRMADVMDEHRDCVMLSPELMAPDGNPGLMMGDPPRGGIGVSVVASRKLLTACIAIRANDLRFDERFLGSGFEDNQYCDDLRERHPEGTWMIVHDVRVVHRNEMKNQGGAIFEENKRRYEQKRGEKWGSVS